MKDGYGRKIEYMRVSVTDRCNLRCVYCMPADGVQWVDHSGILTFEEIVRICRIGTELGISKIKLTGGEPLVRHNLASLVRLLKETKGIEQVTLTTNGILLKDQLDDLVSAGVDAINVSLDTLDEEYYKKITRTGELSRVLEAIDAALSYGNVKVKINCVPMKDTKNEEYIRLAGLAKEKPLEIRFIEMMPVGLGKEFVGIASEQMAEILESAYGKYEEYTKKLGNGPAKYVHFKGFSGRIGFISAVSHQFCGTCNRIRLTAEGSLKPCLQYGTAADLRGLMRSGAGDDEIKAVMEKMILHKPEHHCFADGDNLMGGLINNQLETKRMSEIGG